MDERALREAVEEAYPGVPIEVVNLYIRQRPGPYKETDTEAVAQWGLLMLRSVGQTEPKEPLSPLAPGSIVTSEALWVAIAPWVADVRRALEEAAEGYQLPFDRYEEAAAWIKKHARGEARVERHRQGGRLSVRVDVLPYVEPGSSQVIHVAVPKEGPIGVLARAADSMARVTGFHPARIVALILADIPPILAPATVTTTMKSHPIPTGGTVRRTEVRVTIRSSEIGRSDWEVIRKQVRSAWDAVKQKPVTEADHQLLEAIERHGGVPSERGRKRAFWELVADDLGDRDWNAPRMRWHRVQQKLEMRFGSAAGPT